MTKTWQETESRNADDHGAIAGKIVERSIVANDTLGPVVLASLMSASPVCSPAKSPSASPQDASAESAAKQRETTVDDLLTDPMMAALWRAYAISETDVRALMMEIADRLRSHGELHRRAEALVMARCA
jgi:hypothetical protein